VLIVGFTSGFQSSRILDHDKTPFYRERLDDMSVSAYFLSKMTVDALVVAIRALLFAMIWFTISVPPMWFSDLFLIIFLLCWMNSGAAYVLTSFMNGTRASLASFAWCLLTGTVLGGVTPTLLQLTANGGVGTVASISATRWAMELIVTRQWVNLQSPLADANDPIFNTTVGQGFYLPNVWGFALSAWPGHLFPMLAWGIFFRGLALLLFYKLQKANI